MTFPPCASEPVVNYDKVIDALYAGILAPDGFQSSLRSLNQEFNTESCWVVVWDRVADLIRVCGAAGIPAEFQAAYESHYQHTDPAKETFHSVPVAQWWIDGREMGSSRMRRSEFHQEFLRPFGMASYMGSPVLRSAEQEIALSFLNRLSAGVFTGEQTRSINRIVPHLRNAVLLQQKFLALASAQALGQAVLERLHFGLAVIDARMQVLLENSSGRAWLSALGSRRAWTHSLAGTQVSFYDLILRACKAGAARPQARALHLPGSPACYMVVLPLDASHRFLQGLGSAAGLVIFYPTERPLNLLSAVLRDLFDLTPSECRLAIKMADGSSLDEAAEALHLRRETVCSMLKQVFQKTATHTQAQLLRVLTVLNTAAPSSDTDKS
ncbi:MAG: hypothetical protein JOZ12_16500 [Sinobacteraceae bacterium]|nr:hypothetical protein [Nevskiaceae bacterium]